MADVSCLGKVVILSTHVDEDRGVGDFTNVPRKYGSWELRDLGSNQTVRTLFH